VESGGRKKEFTTEDTEVHRVHGEKSGVEE
jgi:hypothetical protein